MPENGDFVPFFRICVNMNKQILLMLIAFLVFLALSVGCGNRIPDLQKRAEGGNVKADGAPAAGDAEDVSEAEIVEEPSPAK